MRKSAIFDQFMRKHNGMRPQDVAILLKIVAKNQEDWQIQPLSNELRPNRNNSIEFLQHGVKYVFPQNPGAMSRGLPTAHSHPFMKSHFHSETNYVWPDARGEVLGQVIEPFYERQVEAARDDSEFYLLLALVDAIRVGRVRESKIASDELKRILLK
jgi:hypothetical protein